MQTSLRTSQMRELDVRSRDGIRVRLLWQPSTDALFVEVADEETGDRFQVEVDPGDALGALDEAPDTRPAGAEAWHWR